MSRDDDLTVRLDEAEQNVADQLGEPSEAVLDALHAMTRAAVLITVDWMNAQHRAQGFAEDLVRVNFPDAREELDA